ncbi:MAG: PHP domain-containing protein [Desulfurococcaceae archaeon]
MALIKADLHIHSIYSDGKGSPIEILHTSMSKNIGIISITDHDTFEGSIKARALSKNKELPLVILGIEMRTDKGDILVYCINQVNLPKRLDDLIDKAHDENCLIVPAHPFDIFKLGIGDEIFNYRDWDAIEIWNATASKGSNYEAIRAAKLLEKPGIANSDAHVLEAIGVAHTIIEIDDLKPELVLEAIRKNNVRPIFGTLSTKTYAKMLAWGLERRIRKIF